MFLLTVAAVAAVSTDWRSPIRTLLALVFLIFVPGLALVELLAITDPLLRTALAAGASLALETVVALVLLYAKAFSVELILLVVAGITVTALAIAVLRANPDVAAGA